MTKEKKVKKLTLADLKKENKKLDAVKTEKVTTKTGAEYEIDIDETFRNSKINNLIDDLVTLLNEVPNGRPDLLNVTTIYTSLLLIKHFTNIEVSDVIDEALSTLNALLDLEIFEQIITLLPSDEVIKVYDKIAEVVANMNKNVEEAEKQEELMLEQIENHQVRELIQ